jgi:predicted nucleic-acid-binding Zn-ribbon protein
MKASKQCPKCHSLKVGHLEPFGEINGLRPETYVCTECGYQETYVQNLASVAFDRIVGFRWVNEPPPAGGAYR